MLAVAGCIGTETSRSTGTYIDDKTITTRIKAELAADSLTQAIQVEVETYKSVVLLSGFVDSQTISFRTWKITRGFRGLRG